MRELAGVLVNRVERMVEHRAGLAEIASYFRARPRLVAVSAQADGAA
jgi:hypothetical protein